MPIQIKRIRIPLKKNCIIYSTEPCKREEVLKTLQKFYKDRLKKNNIYISPEVI